MCDGSLDIAFGQPCLMECEEDLGHTEEEVIQSCDHRLPDESGGSVAESASSSRLVEERSVHPKILYLLRSPDGDFTTRGAANVRAYSRLNWETPA